MRLAEQISLDNISTLIGKIEYVESALASDLEVWERKEYDELLFDYKHSLVESTRRYNSVFKN